MLDCAPRNKEHIMEILKWLVICYFLIAFACWMFFTIITDGFPVAHAKAALIWPYWLVKLIF